MPLVSDEVIDLFNQFGDLTYGENVTQREHALQCAYLARESDAPDSLILAALLHDIGHLLAGTDYKAAHLEDDRHEWLGDRWIQQHYGPEVSEPVRLHVDAKRYICSKEPEYLDFLSEASRISLELQGGPMSEAETLEFEQNPWFQDAVRLRRWDDEGKQDVVVPTLESYVNLINGMSTIQKTP